MGGSMGEVGGWVLGKSACYVEYGLWPLTLKFDSATGLFLKFDMRHGAYRHETKY